MTDEMRIQAMRDVLDEIAKNAENVTKGGLPHFSKKEFADTVAWRARQVLGQTASSPEESK